MRNPATFDPLTGAFIYRSAWPFRYMMALLATIGAIKLLCGCMCYGPITVNVLSSRMVQANGTNTVKQAVDGGAATSPQLDLGDSAIKAAADGLNPMPQNATGALDALMEMKP